MLVASMNSVEEDKYIELNKENIPERKKKSKIFLRLIFSKEFDATQFETNQYQIIYLFIFCCCCCFVLVSI